MGEVGERVYGQGGLKEGWGRPRGRGLGTWGPGGKLEDAVEGVRDQGAGNRDVGG